MSLGKKFKVVLSAILASLCVGCATYKSLIGDKSLNVNSKVSESYGEDRYLACQGIKKSMEKGDIYSNMSWQEAIKYVRNPSQVKDYFKRHFSYDPEPTFYIPGLITLGKQKGESFRFNHEKRVGSCFDYATVAAALLSDNGYPPLILDMRRDKDTGHSVFLYWTKDGYRCLGNGSVDNPQPTISDLIHECEKQFTDKAKMRYYWVINLDEEIPNRRWLNRDMNLIVKMPN